MRNENLIIIKKLRAQKLIYLVLQAELEKFSIQFTSEKMNLSQAWGEWAFWEKRQRFSRPESWDRPGKKKVTIS